MVSIGSGDVRREEETDYVNKVDSSVFVLDQQLGGLDLGDWGVLLEL